MNLYLKMTERDSEAFVFRKSNFTVIKVNSILEMGYFFEIMCIGEILNLIP